MSTLPLVAFFAFFGLAGLGVFLADRMFRARGQAFLRSYALHMAFWNGHALVMIMQFILGTEFLPSASWAPLTFVTAPVILLLAAVSMYFLMAFAAQAGGGKLPRLVSAVSVVLWAGLALYFVLQAGAGTGAPDDAAGRAYAAPFLALKVATVLGSMGYLIIRSSRSGTRGEGRALRLVAGTYVVGLLVFQLSVSGRIPVYRLPAHDYLIALIQVGFHFPVLAALALYARRRASARPLDPITPDVSCRLAGLGVSPREAEIAGLVMRGFSNKEIGAELFISLDTVKKHLSSIYQKAGVKNRLQLSLLSQKPPSSPSP
jgi:DNA-binding CsgD family transcriptional regulator